MAFGLNSVSSCCWSRKRACSTASRRGDKDRRTDQVVIAATIDPSTTGPAITFNQNTQVTCREYGRLFALRSGTSGSPDRSIVNARAARTQQPGGRLGLHREALEPTRAQQRRKSMPSKVLLLVPLAGMLAGTMVGALLVATGPPCHETAVCRVDVRREGGCQPGPCDGQAALPATFWVCLVMGLVLGLLLAVA